MVTSKGGIACPSSGTAQAARQDTGHWQVPPHALGGQSADPSQPSGLVLLQAATWGHDPSMEV